MSTAMHEPQPVLLAAIIGAFSTIIVGLLAYFGGRGAQHATQQEAFNTMAATLLKTMQEREDRCTERLDAMEQLNRSLIEQLIRAGIPIVTPKAQESFILLDHGKAEKQ